MEETAGTRPASTYFFLNISAPSEVEGHGSEEDSSQEHQEGNLELILARVSLGTEDTKGILEFRNAGHVLFDIKKCHVHLSVKVNNCTMLCGHDRTTCAPQISRTANQLGENG
jgi:hypothetical protein